MSDETMFDVIVTVDVKVPEGFTMSEAVKAKAEALIESVTRAAAKTVEMVLMTAVAVDRGEAGKAGEAQA